MSNETNDVNLNTFKTDNIDGVPNLPSGPPKTGTREHEQRLREIDGLYGVFTNLMKEPVIITQKQFDRFKPLYCSKNLAEINPQDETQTGPLRDLCDELLNLVGKFKEFHVKQLDGTFVTYPPIFTPVNLLNNDLTESLDIFKNLIDKCGDQPWKRADATANFIGALYSSQNPKMIEAQRNKFKRIADKLHESVIKRPEQAIAEPGVEVPPMVAATKHADANVTSDLNFILD